MGRVQREVRELLAQVQRDTDRETELCIDHQTPRVIPVIVCIIKAKQGFYLTCYRRRTLVPSSDELAPSIE